MPRSCTRIEEEFAAVLAAVPDGAAKDAGITLGQQAARANLEKRASDEIEAGPWPPHAGPVTEPVYQPSGKPGDYDFTPPFDVPPLGPIALFPGWGRLTPFAIDLSQHRFRGRDPLTSPRYARDVNLLKSVGRLESAARTSESVGGRIGREVGRLLPRSRRCS